MFKKVTSSLLAVSLMFSFSACGKGDKNVSGYSGNNSSQSQKTITVSVPASNRALEMAISKFQNEHPECKIEVQTYPGQNNTGSDYETYVKNLNTQILTGKGPDIISVAGLPYDNYISRNILADIGELMSNDKSFDVSKYYSNIFDAMKQNSKLYVLPVDFTFNVLMANQGILDQESVKIPNKWTWDEFKSIAGKLTRKEGGDNAGYRFALPAVGSYELLNLFTRGSYSNYINAGKKSANFTSQGFTDLLNTVRDINDSLSDSNIKMDMVSILEAAGRGSIVFYPYTISDYNMYGFMKAAFKDQLSLYNLPSADGASEGSFSSNTLYAVNKNSKFKSESWEFLKALISDEVQSQSMEGKSQVQTQTKGSAGASINIGGFSINKLAQQQKALQAMNTSKGGNIKMGVKTSGGGSITLSPAAMTQEDIDRIDKFISGLKLYAKADESIGSIVKDETKAFFSGSKSAVDTAKLIQDRVNTYLGE